MAQPPIYTLPDVQFDFLTYPVTVFLFYGFPVGTFMFRFTHRGFPTTTGLIDLVDTGDGYYYRQFESGTYGLRVFQYDPLTHEFSKFVASMGDFVVA